MQLADTKIALSAFRGMETMRQIRSAAKPLSERHIQLCDVFGRQARLHLNDVSWPEACQRISLQWETLRRFDEPPWAVVRPLVQRAFERADAELRNEDPAPAVRDIRSTNRS
jgi:hypothetical protein